MGASGFRGKFCNLSFGMKLSESKNIRLDFILICSHNQNTINFRDKKSHFLIKRGVRYGSYDTK